MPRNAKTTELLKECMADALIRLMRTKPFEKISVQEITDAAGVGRATWFRHFTGKDEAISFKLTCLWERWKVEHPLGDVGARLNSIANEFFRFCYQLRDFLRMLYEEKRQSVIYAVFSQLSGSFATEVNGQYQSTFLSFGLFGLLDAWIRRNFRETPEEMAALFLDAVRGSGVAAL